MESSIFRISLDFHQQVTQTHLSVKKGDTAQKIVAALSNGGRPYLIREDCHAVFKGKKPDGHVLYNDCAIINNCIVYEFTEQTASVAGYMHCELQLYGPDGKIITSPKFAIIVSGLVYDDSEVESSDEFTALGKAMTEVAELKANGLKGDPGPQGEPGPMGPQGELFRIHLFEVAAGNYEADKNYDAIKHEYEAGQQILCCVETEEQQWMELPLVKETNGVLEFGAIIGDAGWKALISRGEDGEAVVETETIKFANADDLAGKADVVVATDEKYFIITDDGMVYLKPEYRGAVGAQQANSSMGKYCKSDNGAGVAGSLNGELPEKIVIPEMIGDTPVNSLAPATFGNNIAIKRIVLPAGITKIPNFCFYMANRLEVVVGMENVTEVGNGAFRETNITQALFPRLEKLGTNVFVGCVMLRVADIGSVAEVPGGTFSDCIRLHTVRNGANVTKVGASAFYSTSKLKTPVFISQLESIGDYGFQYSRANANWGQMNCDFGVNATALQLNPADWWSDCEPAVCEIPMRSTFDQSNPLWVNEKIVPGQDETWGGGCTICACAHVYSAYEELDMETPAEFVAVALERDLTLVQLPLTYKATYIKYLEAVGYTVETINAETGNELTVGNDLQHMYDALADGNLVIMGVCVDNVAIPGHCVVVHGVNEFGELLVIDSDGKARSSGVHLANIHPMPVQNFTKGNSDFVIVKK